MRLMKRLVSLALNLNSQEMKKHVMKDKMIFRFVGRVESGWKRDPRFTPCYILLPLLTREERNLFLLQIRAVAERKRTGDGISKL